VNKGGRLREPTHTPPPEGTVSIAHTAGSKRTEHMIYSRAANACQGFFSLTVAHKIPNTQNQQQQVAKDLAWAWMAIVMGNCCVQKHRCHPSMGGGIQRSTCQLSTRPHPTSGFLSTRFTQPHAMHASCKLALQQCPGIMSSLWCTIQGRLSKLCQAWPALLADEPRPLVVPIKRMITSNELASACA